MFVRGDHLPGRLDQPQPPGQNFVGEPGSEPVIQHPFPRDQLEQGRDRRIVQIDKPARPIPIPPTDIRQADDSGRQPSLGRAGGEIGHGALVLGVRRDAGQVQARRARCGAVIEGEGLDQLVVDRIELVGFRKPILQPPPLDNTGLDQSGRRVAVQLQQLQVPAVKRQVKTRVERGLETPTRPAGLDQRNRGRVVTERRQRLIGQDLADRFQAQAI